MALRVILAAIVCGMILFGWESVYHVVLGLGQQGMKGMPNEDAVLTAMKENLRDPGMYFFPGYDMTTPMSEPAQKAWTEKYRSGPSGIMVYRPSSNEDPMTPRQLGIQLGLDVFSMLVVGGLLSLAAPALPQQSALRGRLRHPRRNCGHVAGLELVRLPTRLQPCHGGEVRGGIFDRRHRHGAHHPLQARPGAQSLTRTKEASEESPCYSVS